MNYSKIFNGLHATFIRPTTPFSTYQLRKSSGNMQQSMNVISLKDDGWPKNSIKRNYSNTCTGSDLKSY